MKPEYIDCIRDSAIALEKARPRLAFELMRICKEFRPSGPIISSKYEQYSETMRLLTSSFLDVHIHIGTHKTATTYLQDQLEKDLKESKIVNYIPREELRLLLKKFQFIEILDFQNKNVPLLISEENILGDTSTPLSGRIYPGAKHEINKMLSSFKAQRVTVYITLRSITGYLSSAYCEMLRFKNYISFNEYKEKININKFSWLSVFKDAIIENSNVNFKVFDFHKFSKEKERLLNDISYGVSSNFSDEIEKSRSSFTNKELHEISEGDWSILDDNKFDPFSSSEHEHAYAQLMLDIQELNTLSNVTIISQ